MYRELRKYLSIVRKRFRWHHGFSYTGAGVTHLQGGLAALMTINHADGMLALVEKIVPDCSCPSWLKSSLITWES